MMNRKVLMAVLLGVFCACWLSACKGDDDVPEPVPVNETGAELQIQIVFSPQQLGDEGYADNVFDGIQSVASILQSSGKDTLDASFISSWSRSTTKQALMSWASNRKNPFYGNEYKRRLLVLTEPFMIHWLESIKDTLSDTDDVLMLKTSEHLIDSVGKALGMSDRLFGLNISPASSIRKFCRFMKYFLDIAEEEGDDFINIDVLPIFRLYPDSEVDYQDSLYIVLKEELGDDAVLEVTSLSNEKGEGIYSGDEKMTSLTTITYNMAANMQRYYEDFGYAFSIVDLGASVAGWKYYCLELPSKSYTTLLMDAGVEGTPSYYYIHRRFGIALASWISNWLMDGSKSLPRMVVHGNWELPEYADELKYCIDNLPNV